jgi:hypothetical protein
VVVQNGPLDPLDDRRVEEPATSAEEIEADIASISWKLCTRLACTRANSVRTLDWTAAIAFARIRALARRAGRLVSWLRKMMIDRCRAPDDKRLTSAALRAARFP